jgi:hypothetical protein
VESAADRLGISHDPAAARARVASTPQTGR